MKTILLNTAKAIRSLILTGILAFIFSGYAFGSHTVGGEITYQWVSGNTYNVKVALYRDCLGITLPISLSVNYASVLCGSNGTFTANQIGLPEQVTPICTAQLNNSSCNGGLVYGIERVNYEGQVTLPLACSDWIINTYECCRSANVDNLDNSAAYGSYFESKLNNLDVPFNNSVAFGSIPLNIINNNSTTTLSWNAYDVDGDSLIYELIPARDAIGMVPSNIPYNAGYTYNQPLLASQPTTLDYTSGLLEVSPNATQISVVCMRITEYRNGIVIGEVNRDFQIMVQNSLNNNPTLTGIAGTTSFVTNGCPGTPIIFDVISNDVDSGQNVTIHPDPFNPNGTWYMGGGPNPIGTFSWTPLPGNISSQPYVFTVTVTDDNCDYNGTQTYAYHIYVNGCNTYDVWPGDANSDGAADLYDLLSIGVAFNDTGVIRSLASNNWVGQPCIDWTNSFISGINHKHADTDGNGIVNFDDTTAIMSNYGSYHALRVSPETALNVVDLNVTANFDSVGTQTAVNFDISLSSNVDSIYGIAFRMHFDPLLVDLANTQISFNNSIFGTNGMDMVNLGKIYTASGFMDIALTKINHQNISGSGQLARITIVTTDNVSGKVTLNVEPFSVVAITADESPILVNTSGDNVIIDPDFVGVNEINDQMISVHPVPANDLVNFSFSGQETIESIRFYDLNGREVMNVEHPSGKMIINMQSVAKGVYYMKVTIGENIFVKKIVKI